MYSPDEMKRMKRMAAKAAKRAEQEARKRATRAQGCCARILSDPQQAVWSAPVQCFLGRSARRLKADAPASSDWHSPPRFFGNGPSVLNKRQALSKKRHVVIRLMVRESFGCGWRNTYIVRANVLEQAVAETGVERACC